ncbi:MAG: hypothetical protein ACJATT_004249 [Myxococcota bacterium]
MYTIGKYQHALCRRLVWPCGCRRFANDDREKAGCGACREPPLQRAYRQSKLVRYHLPTRIFRPPYSHPFANQRPDIRRIHTPRHRWTLTPDVPREFFHTPTDLHGSASVTRQYGVAQGARRGRIVDQTDESGTKSLKPRPERPVAGAAMRASVCATRHPKLVTKPAKRWLPAVDQRGYATPLLVLGARRALLAVCRPAPPGRPLPRSVLDQASGPGLCRATVARIRGSV